MGTSPDASDVWSLRRIAAEAAELYWGEAWLTLWRCVEARALALDLHLALRARANPVVVDAGCGDGRFFDLVIRAADVRGAVCVGVDSDPVRLRRLLLTRTVSPHPVLADLSHVPIRSGIVDAFIANSTIEHCTDPESVLAEARRVLRSDGILLMTVPSIHFETYLAGYRLRHAIGLHDSARKWAAHKSQRIQHLEYLDPTQWKTRLGRAGFSNISVQPIAHPLVVFLGDPLQWIRDAGIGGSRYSTRSPTDPSASRLFRMIRATAIAVETVIARVSGSRIPSLAKCGGYYIRAEVRG